MTPTALLTVVLMLQAGAPASTSLSPQAHTLAEAYYLFLQGKELEGRDELPAAAARYREALTLLPDAAEIRSDLASVYAQQGDLDGARREAQRALELAPSSRSAHRLLGLIEASSIERAPAADVTAIVLSAIAHLERSRVADTRDPAVMLALGELYVRGEQHQQAIVVLEDFLLDRPGFPQAMVLLAHAYRASGQPDRAEAIFGAFRGRSADTAAAQLRGIEASEARGEWREAAAAWARLIEQQPRETTFRLRYAAALVNSGQVSVGRDELHALTRDEPSDIRAWHLLAQVEQRAGHTEAAEAAARRIVELDPEDGRGPIALARVLAYRDDHRGVVTVLEPRVTAPTDVDLGTGLFAQMAIMLNEAWGELGQVRRGIRVLEEARKRTPADQQLLFSLAATYERDDQFGRAERAFREIITADPEHARALNYLGYMLADRGRKLPEALTLIQRAIAIGGENPAYLDSLGWAYYRMSRYDDAVGPLERAASGAPQISVIQDHLGDAYVKLGRHEEAAAAFDRALAGDRDGIDERALTRKRDRARAASSRR